MTVAEVEVLDAHRERSVIARSPRLDFDLGVQAYRAEPQTRRIACYHSRFLESDDHVADVDLVRLQ